ncbi:MAG: chemotaxis protein CheW [Pseudomonadota bacterium]
MANRQALRELQSRLAERLLAARTKGVSASWLAVEAGDGRYLFPLGQSGEIFPWNSPQPVPYTQDWFVGVANLRGGLFGIVDLGRYLGRAGTATRGERSANEARFVALNAAIDVNCALLVDRLSGLRNAEAFSEFTEPESGSPAFFGHRYVDLQGKVWQEINLQQLAQQAHFLTIGA